jgi:rhodanese-related sulfurtransferase
MKMRLKLAIALIPLGIIIAAVPENTTKQYKLTANQLLDEVKEGIQFVTTDQIADMLVQKDPSLQLIDVRSSDEFDKFHLPEAINIPLTNLLATEFEEVLNQDVKMNVFYSNGTTQSNEAWMIIRQLGYVNNYVLQGGLNHWAETIMKPEAPAQTSPDDELAKYDFRMGASQALGGASAVSTGNSNSKAAAPAPGVQKTAKKKKASGGC